MSKPLPVNDDDFDQTVLHSQKPVLVDLWAPWCKPCKMVAPVLDELADEYDGKINFVKVDIDQNPKTATKYGIMSIPALLIFKEGKPVSQMVGLRSKGELKRSLDDILDKTL
ncbi:thioredoxin [Chloroflexota bacterium]